MGFAEIERLMRGERARIRRRIEKDCESWRRVSGETTGGFDWILERGGKKVVKSRCRRGGTEQAG